MRTEKPQAKQHALTSEQISAFYSDRLTNDQVDHFLNLLTYTETQSINTLLDIGGGCGHFARQVVDRTAMKAYVLDSDPISIARCNAQYGDVISARLDDALNPIIHGDEDIVSFNLILHHLIGKNESATRVLQRQALLTWRDQAKLLFVNEYCYDSYIGNASGYLIYQITKNKFLSLIASQISRFIPSLNANTFFVGVRFRSHNEWQDFFSSCGFQVIACSRGKNETVSLPRRLLLIKRKARDSFLLRLANK